LLKIQIHASFSFVNATIIKESECDG
jgi:hypothetical protein